MRRSRSGTSRRDCSAYRPSVRRTPPSAVSTAWAFEPENPVRYRTFARRLEKSTTADDSRLAQDTGLPPLARPRLSAQPPLAPQRPRASEGFAPVAPVRSRRDEGGGNRGATRNGSRFGMGRSVRLRERWAPTLDTPPTEGRSPPGILDAVRVLFVGRLA